MARHDIRDDRSGIDIKYDSERGQVARNNGSFTRGSNLLTHQFFMFLGGAKWPVYLSIGLLLVWMFVFHFVLMEPFQWQMLLTKVFYDIAMVFGLPPEHPYTVILSNTLVRHTYVGLIDTDPYIRAAVRNFWQLVIASIGMTIITAVLPIVGYIEIAKKRGVALLKDHHKRGAILLPYDQLRNSILANNEREAQARARDMFPDVPYQELIRWGPERLNKAGFPLPYRIAEIQFPFGLELSHVMLIGTTTTGKTVVFSDLLAQARQRMHSAVIFDITGVFTERFYDPKRDIILNPYDARCARWSLFDDFRTEVEIKTAALSLIPSTSENADPFWAMAARTLLTEMCLKLIEDGSPSNDALITALMTADLADIHAKLIGTIADPITSPEVARMAESVRAVLNANADALLSLPETGEAFSIRNWIEAEKRDGSFLFISTRYDDMAVTRALITLWVNTAIYALMNQPHSRAIKMWFMLDELGALHQLPSLEYGLQTSRNFGGAVAVGVHDFAQLRQIYGDNGAMKIIGLTNNKMFLRVTDDETAEKCSNLIGKREVREMDESYSISNSNARDTSTLTARTEVRALVMPDDLMNLKNLHGYVKLSDGYPATKIVLQYRRYPEAAERFVPRVGPTRSRRLKEARKPDSEAGSVEAGGVEAKVAAAQASKQIDLPAHSEVTDTRFGELPIVTDGQLNLPGLQVVGGSGHHDDVEPLKVVEQPAPSNAMMIPKTPSQVDLAQRVSDRNAPQETVAVQNAQRGIGDGNEASAASRENVHRRDEMGPEL